MSNVAQILKKENLFQSFSIGPILNKSRKLVQKMQEFSILRIGPILKAFILVKDLILFYFKSLNYNIGF